MSGKGIPPLRRVSADRHHPLDHFFEATGNAVMSMLVGREGLLRKIRFPRMVVPLSAALTAVFNLVDEPDRGAGLHAASTVSSPAWSWLELIPIVLGCDVSPPASAMLLSALYVRFRDIQPIWDVMQPDPVLRLADHVHRPDGRPSQTGAGIPSPAILVSTRSAHHHADTQGALANRRALGRTARSAACHRLLIPLAIVAGLFALGLWYFNREAPRDLGEAVAM